MDPLRNPFSPGAGTQPPELVGRQDILDQALLALARIKIGRSERSLFLIGLRGVGKTVLLNKISVLAQEEGYKTVMIEVPENKGLPELLISHLRKILYALDDGANRSEKVRKALSIFKSFIRSIKVKVNDIEFGLDIEPEQGSADSGDLESDLTDLFIALGEAARDKQVGIAIMIDELQYISEKELSALIMAVHKVSQQALPLIVIGAGLPQLVGKAGRSKSYAERLFTYPNVGPLNSADAKKALQDPVMAEIQGTRFTEEALNEITRVTQGYPYFLQEWGYQAWNLAHSSPIGIDVIKAANIASLKRLDENFFRVRFDRLTPREKEYLRALAELGSNKQRSGEIADKIGLDANQAAPIRNNLIKKGMIYSPTYGDTAFTVPLFEEFMKRTIPVFEKPPKHIARK
jgi:hypothetical protein